MGRDGKYNLSRRDGTANTIFHDGTGRDGKHNFSRRDGTVNKLFTTRLDGRTIGPLLPVPNVSCILFNVVVSAVVVRH